MHWLSKFTWSVVLISCVGAASAQKSALVARGKYLAEGVVACGFHGVTVR